MFCTALPVVDAGKVNKVEIVEWSGLLLEVKSEEGN